MIILEGADGSGKSTLAKALHNMLGWQIVGSEGPPKGPNELIERIERYHRMSPDTIFDRHPVISDPIYSEAFGRESPVTLEHRRRVLGRMPLIVYCVSPTGLLGPQDNPLSDNEQYVMKLEKKHESIKTAYHKYFTRCPPDAVYYWDRSVPRALLEYMARRVK